MMATTTTMAMGDDNNNFVSDGRTGYYDNDYGDGRQQQ